MDPNVRSLVSAFLKGNEALACKLLAEHASLRDASLPDLGGKSRTYFPLHVAAFTGQAAVAKELLELGADPSVPEPTHKGWSPLDFAAQHSHAAVAECLIDAGAKVDQQDQDGRTALHWCAANDSPAVAKLLIAAGANPSIADAEGNTAIQIAQNLQHKEVVALLEA